MKEPNQLRQVRKASKTPFVRTTFPEPPKDGFVLCSYLSVGPHLFLLLLREFTVFQVLPSFPKLPTKSLLIAEENKIVPLPSTSALPGT